MTDNGTVRVRNACRDDLEAICEILLSTGVCESGGLMARLESLCNQPGAICLVAMQGTGVAGVALATYNGFHVFLTHLAVGPTRQRQGIGTALNQELLAAAVQLGAQGVIVDSRLTATGFFHRLGYEMPGAVFLIKRLP